MDGSALLAASKEKSPSHTQLALMEAPRDRDSDDAVAVVPDTTDDDIVLDPSHGKRLQEVSVSSEFMQLGVHHPAARGVGADVIDLVTDAFKEARERLVEKRRRVLYQITHPDPSDYTYGGKLVPPPPLSFGRVTEEAIRLGNKVMLGQRYSLVKRAGMYRDEDDEGSMGTSSGTTIGQHRRGRYRTSLYAQHNFFFEINELYQEIVLVGKACAGKSSLLNALLGQQVAKTSSTPNTTRKISFYQSVSPEEMQRYLNVRGNGLVKLPGGGLQLTFVDVPGFGIEGMSEQWRDKAIELTDAYLGVRRSVNTVLLCIDCERGLTKVDLRYFSWLENLHGVFFVVLTKCDTVPHSRVCSVMRQIYSAITQHRRKYRKVFPFIIPTSASDGTNIDILRGLIAETSGLIPGDKLRRILRAKAEAEMRLGLEKEEERLREARATEAQLARAYFETTNDGKCVSNDGGSAPESTPLCTSSFQSRFQLPSTPASSHGAPGIKSPQRGQKFVFSPNPGGKDARVEVSPLPADNGAAEPVLVFQSSDTSSGFGKLSNDERAKRRERFLAWRHAHPLQRHETAYGVFRLNTGLERPDASSVQLAYGGGDSSTSNAQPSNLQCDSRPQTPSPLPQAEVGGCAGDFQAGDSSFGGAGGAGGEEVVAPPVSTGVPSAVIGFALPLAGGGQVQPVAPKGNVSRFLHLVDRYAQREAPQPRSKREQMKEARWRARLGGGTWDQVFC